MWTVSASEFPSQMANNAESGSMSCRHHVMLSDYTQDIIQTQIVIDLDLMLSATVRLYFSFRNMYVWKGVFKCDYMYYFSRISHAHEILYMGNLWLWYGCAVRIYWHHAVD